MSGLRGQCCPLSNRIYVGRINKTGDAWVGGKTDVTGDVVGAVIQMVGCGMTLTVTDNHGDQFEITVKKVRK